MRIAICGKICSGKSYLAKYLANKYDAEIYSFGYGVKKYCKEIFDMKIKLSYWSANILIVIFLLSIWFLSSFGAGILFAEYLDKFQNRLNILQIHLNVHEFLCLLYIL